MEETKKSKVTVEEEMFASLNEDYNSSGTSLKGGSRYKVEETRLYKDGKTRCFLFLPRLYGDPWNPSRQGIWVEKDKVKITYESVGK